MGEIFRQIKINYSDTKLNTMLAAVSPDDVSKKYRKCYDYNEEFFLKLDSAVIVPHFPIHHDIGKPEPESGYLDKLIRLFAWMFRLIPDVFAGLTYFFNPIDILRPGFFKLYRYDNMQYLYLVRVDLLFKPQSCEITDKGTNDITHEYETNQVFLDARFIPLSEVKTAGGKIESFEIKDTISEIWIGESGRGYFRQGIWIDTELSKLFSKLFLPSGKSTYPYYPFVCQYKTICGNIIDFSPNRMEADLAYLHNAIRFLSPVMGQIESGLKQGVFSEDLEIYKSLKMKIPAVFADFKKNVNVTSYLNGNNMKEYEIDTQR
jgi:hypothetical protein